MNFLPTRRQKNSSRGHGASNQTSDRTSSQRQQAVLIRAINTTSVPANYTALRASPWSTDIVTEERVVVPAAPRNSLARNEAGRRKEFALSTRKRFAEDYRRSDRDTRDSFRRHLLQSHGVLKSVPVASFYLFLSPPSVESPVRLQQRKKEKPKWKNSGRMLARDKQDNYISIKQRESEEVAGKEAGRKGEWKGPKGGRETARKNDRWNV